MEIGNLRKGKKPTIFKKKKGERNAHQHAYDCCRLRLSAQIKSATHKRENGDSPQKKLMRVFPFQLIMRTMIQPSHRTVCSSFLFFLLFFPPFFSVKKKRKRRRIKKTKPRAILCVFFLLHTHTISCSENRISVPLWSVLEAIAHSPWYHTRQPHLLYSMVGKVVVVVVVV